jgi:mRNA interferase RelE/StbE
LQYFIAILYFPSGCIKTIVYTTGAAKTLDSLPDRDRAAIIEALDAYAMTGFASDIRRLQGRHGLRMRVGSYRIIFDEDAVTILTISIGRRTTTTYRN